MNSMPADRITWAGLVETFEGLVLLLAVGLLLYGCQAPVSLPASPIGTGQVDAHGLPIHPISHTREGELRVGDVTAWGPANEVDQPQASRSKKPKARGQRKRRARVNEAKLRARIVDLELLLAEAKGEIQLMRLAATRGWQNGRNS